MALSYGAANCTTVTKINSAKVLAITIWNNDIANTLYIGFDGGVTASTGFPIPAQTAFTFDYTDVAPAGDYFGIGVSDVRWVGRT